MDPRIVGCIT